eukprot:TRINITY_DN4926_c0_g1_i1.p1 TRINITY_DN4926_c0_g1~~TRINITY_DN4926_c0_g1_i1.p1  ORF type:complete len:336 (+),score=53.63 TRINITY_DN4926_c0_g1_i1:239-1246(+)
MISPANVNDHGVGVLSPAAATATTVAQGVTVFESWGKISWEEYVETAQALVLASSLVEGQAEGWSWVTPNKDESRKGSSYLRKTLVIKRSLDTPPSSSSRDPSLLAGDGTDGLFEEDFDSDGDGGHDLDSVAGCATDDDDSDMGALPVHCAPADVVYDTFELHVLYSLSYAVPVLYFNASRTDGAPLSMEEVLECLPGAQAGVTRKHLSQNEHPINGIPFFFIHPCETAQLMKNVPSVVRRQQQQRTHGDIAGGDGERDKQACGRGNHDHDSANACGNDSCGCVGMPVACGRGPGGGCMKQLGLRASYLLAWLSAVGPLFGYYVDRNYFTCWRDR